MKTKYKIFLIVSYIVAIFTVVYFWGYWIKNDNMTLIQVFKNIYWIFIPIFIWGLITRILGLSDIE